MKKFAVVFACALATLNSALLAEEDAAFPRQVYDATYTSTTAKTGKTTIRYASDGKGHLRQEEHVAGQTIISLINYVDHKVTTLMEINHMAISMPFKPTAPKMEDQDFAKNANFKSIGTKVVDGHPCHGYASSKDGATSEVWIGDDIQHMVKSEVKSPQGDGTMELVSYSADPPAADLFTVPQGYSEMNMPSMPPQR
jgi:hypothetical protein